MSGVQHNPQTISLESLTKIHQASEQLDRWKNVTEKQKLAMEMALEENKELRLRVQRLRDLLNAQTARTLLSQQTYNNFICFI